jgi:co-chaperonin GroES (HSP10)
MKYTASNFVPRNKRILVTDPPKVDKVGGVYLSPGAQEAPNLSLIDALDPLINIPIENGGSGESLKVGDHVMYHKGAGITFNLNGKDVRLLHVNEILGTYDEAPSK